MRENPLPIRYKVSVLTRMLTRMLVFSLKKASVEKGFLIRNQLVLVLVSSCVEALSHKGRVDYIQWLGKTIKEILREAGTHEGSKSGDK